MDLLAGDQTRLFTARRAGVAVEWECSDPESGVPITFWRPQRNGFALLSKDRWYVSASGARKRAAVATPMQQAMKYSSCVSAMNGAGEMAANYSCSSGFTFDSTKPLAGAVTDFGGRQFVSNATEICTEWTEFADDLSGIEHLIWEFLEAQQDDEVIKRRTVWLGASSPWSELSYLPSLPPPFTTYEQGLLGTDQGHTMCTTLGSSARMEHGHRYFSRVTAQNRAGLVAAAISRSFVVDLTPPSSGRVALRPFFPAGVDNQTDFPASVSGVRLRVQPSRFRDPESGIESYDVTLLADGVVVALSSLGLRDALWWESPDLTLSNGTVLEARVTARNQVGLAGLDVYSSPLVLSLAEMVLEPPWIATSSTEAHGYTTDLYTLTAGVHRTTDPINRDAHVTYRWKILERCDEEGAMVAYDQGAINMARVRATRQALGAVASGPSFLVDSSSSFTLSDGITYCVQLTACAPATVSLPERCKDATSDPTTVDVSVPVAATAIVASISRSRAITQLPFFGEHSSTTSRYSSPCIVPGLTQPQPTEPHSTLSHPGAPPPHPTTPPPPHHIQPAFVHAPQLKLAVSTEAAALQSNGVSSPWAL